MARPASAAGHGRVRIRKRGKFWYARWIDGVTRHEINLELTNKKNAEDKAKEIDDALERGEPWVSGRDRSVVTFAQVVEEYLNKGSRWSENTRRGTKSVLNQLVAEFGERPVADIRGIDIEAYLAKRRDDGMPKSSRNRILAALKSIFRKAAEWGHVPRDRDPAAAVTMEPEGQKQPDPYTGDEVRKLLAELEPRHRRVADVYLQTAMRLGELTRLRWADVNLEARTIAVRSPKNRVDRTIPMSKRVFEIMQELKAINGDSKTPTLAVLGNGADILRPLNRAAERANIEEGRRHRMQHRLRDSAATFMLDAGVPLDRVQVILGHKTLAMTRRYAATRDEHVRAAIEQAFDEVAAY